MMKWGGKIGTGSNLQPSIADRKPDSGDRQVVVPYSLNFELRGILVSSPLQATFVSDFLKPVELEILAYSGQRL